MIEPRKPGHIYVIFDGPPGPESGRFVEVENHEAASVNVGDWLADDRHAGWAMLQIARADLLPAESMAVTVGLARLLRGDQPEPNTAAMCVLALARLTGRHDWTVSQIVHRLPDEVVEMDDGTLWLRSGLVHWTLSGWEFRHPVTGDWTYMAPDRAHFGKCMVQMRRMDSVPEPLAVADVDRLAEAAKGDMLHALGTDPPGAPTCSLCGLTNDYMVHVSSAEKGYHPFTDAESVQVMGVDLDPGGLGRIVDADQASPVMATKRLARMAGFLLGVTEVMTADEADQCMAAIVTRDPSSALVEEATALARVLGWQG